MLLKGFWISLYIVLQMVFLVSMILNMQSPGLNDAFNELLCVESQFNIVKCQQYENTYPGFAFNQTYL